jgi:hypothetical protein
MSLIPVASILSSLAPLETVCPHAIEPTNEKTAWGAGRLQKFPFNPSPLQHFSPAEFLLPSLFRFYSQRELTGQGIEDFRVPERPSIINCHCLEAPLVAIPHQVAIVAIHQ